MILLWRQLIAQMATLEASRAFCVLYAAMTKWRNSNCEFYMCIVMTLECNF
jgi:hypothetical protein